MVLHHVHASRQHSFADEGRRAADTLERLIGAQHPRRLARGALQLNLWNEFNGTLGATALTKTALNAE